MIRCEICKKSVFDAEKHIVGLDTLKRATHRGLVPSYYIEREKDGIEYGLPRDRKWKNIIKDYKKDSMEICSSCLGELHEVLIKKKTRTNNNLITTSGNYSAHKSDTEYLKTNYDVVPKLTGTRRLLTQLYTFFTSF